MRLGDHLVLSPTDLTCLQVGFVYLLTFLLAVNVGMTVRTRSLSRRTPRESVRDLDLGGFGAWEMHFWPGMSWSWMPLSCPPMAVFCFGRRKGAYG